jgi:hypothetical protein
MGTPRDNAKMAQFAGIRSKKEAHFFVVILGQQACGAASFSIEMPPRF